MKERLPATAAAPEAGKQLVSACDEAGISVQALQDGSPKCECTDLRKRLALEYVPDRCVYFFGVVYGRRSDRVVI